jgi:CBS domain-containing protein
MQAREFMTKDLVTVSPDTPTPEIAKLLLAHGISAAPVVDGEGTPIGMVSEGDLLGRGEADREARRDWWLTLLAEGEALHPDFVATLRNPQLTAREVMSAPVVRITETTEAPEIARLLEEYRIKRVPVVRDDRIVGIVSRADCFALGGHSAQHGSGHTSEGRGSRRDHRAIDARFGHSYTAVAAGAPRETTYRRGGWPDRDRFSCADRRFRASQYRARGGAPVGGRATPARVKISSTITSPTSWPRSCTMPARRPHGEKEMLPSFPADLCTDRGRAVNATLPDWSQTLRGEAAEIYLRWERDLKPGGFHLAARVLDFPAAFPGRSVCSSSGANEG